MFCTHGAVVSALLLLAAISSGGVAADDLTGPGDWVEKSLKACHAGQLDEAISCAETAIRRNPKDASAYNARGLALYSKGWRPLQEKALVDFDRAIELAPNIVSYYQFRGLAYQAKGLDRKASSDFQKVESLAPGESAFDHFAKAMEGMEAFERKQGDAHTLPQALREAEKATLLDPTTAAYWHLLGFVHAHNSDGPLSAVMAEDALQKALKLDPSDSASRLLLARLLLNRGAYVPGLDSLEKVVRQQPRLLVSTLAADLCRAYVAVRQAPRGEQFFRSVLALESEGGPARLALAILIHAQGRNGEALRELATLTSEGKTSQKDTEFARRLSRDWKEN